MDIKKGDFVTRKSYNNDTVFKVLNIKNDIYYLKGADVRLYADSPKSDLIKVIKEEDKEDYSNKVKDKMILDRSEYFYLPGKILHFDGDKDYLERCLKFYKETGIKAVGKMVKESELPNVINKYLSCTIGHTYTLDSLLYMKSPRNRPIAIRGLFAAAINLHCFDAA